MLSDEFDHELPCLAVGGAVIERCLRAAIAAAGKRDVLEQEERAPAEGARIVVGRPFRIGDVVGTLRGPAAAVDHRPGAAHQVSRRNGRDPSQLPPALRTMAKEASSAGPVSISSIMAPGWASVLR